MRERKKERKKGKERTQRGNEKTMMQHFVTQLKYLRAVLELHTSHSLLFSTHYRLNVIVLLQFESEFMYICVCVCVCVCVLHSSPLLISPFVVMLKKRIAHQIQYVQEYVHKCGYILVLQLLLSCILIDFYISKYTVHLQKLLICMCVCVCE